MNTKATALFVLLVPGLVMLAACNPTPGPDEGTATAPTTAIEPVDTGPVDTAPVDTAPTEPTPTGAEPGEPITGAAGDDKSFTEMDANSDGSVTQDELSPNDMLHQHFSVADADGDGKLSEAEVTKHRADMAAEPAR